jgi:U3 small nucleolar ribonucleoprotein protein IMP4
MFAKEVRLLFPGAQRMNRGGHVVDDLVRVARANDVSDLVIVHEHRGEPDGLVISHLPFGPTAFFELSNVVRMRLGLGGFCAGVRRWGLVWTFRGRPG